MCTGPLDETTYRTDTFTLNFTQWRPVFEILVVLQNCKKKIVIGQLYFKTFEVFFKFGLYISTLSRRKSTINLDTFSTSDETVSFISLFSFQVDILRGYKCGPIWSTLTFPRHFLNLLLDLFYRRIRQFRRYCVMVYDPFVVFKYKSLRPPTFSF